jgi:hypothetical protein
VQALWLQHHASLSSPSFCPKKIFKTVSSSLKPSTVAQVAPAEARGIYWMSMCEGVVAAAPYIPLQFTILVRSKVKKIFSTVSCSFKPSAVAQVAPAEASGIYEMTICAGVEAAAPFNLLQFIILFKIKSGKYSAQ